MLKCKWQQALRKVYLSQIFGFIFPLNITELQWIAYEP